MPSSVVAFSRSHWMKHNNYPFNFLFRPWRHLNCTYGGIKLINLLCLGTSYCWAILNEKKKNVQKIPFPRRRAIVMKKFRNLIYHHAANGIPNSVVIGTTLYLEQMWIIAIPHEQNSSIEIVIRMQSHQLHDPPSSFNTKKWNSYRLRNVHSGHQNDFVSCHL